MAAVSEAAKLRRDVEILVDLVREARPGSRSALTDKERRALKSDIEWCMQQLDELRNTLTG